MKKFHCLFHKQLSNIVITIFLLNYFTLNRILFIFSLPSAMKDRNKKYKVLAKSLFCLLVLALYQRLFSHFIVASVIIQFGQKHI